MFREDNTFYSRVPQYLGAFNQFIVQQWINIPEVYGAADVRAASDVFNLFGQAGRRERISFLSIDHDWDLWSKDLVCIGGHFKTDRVFEVCAKSLVHYRHPDTFASPDGGRTFTVHGSTDYGLVLKATHPATHKKCLVIMGLGALGTEAAAHYFLKKATMLGRLYGPDDFALLVEVDVNHGRESAGLCWFNPVPSLLRRVRHPLHWFLELRDPGPH